MWSCCEKSNSMRFPKFFETPDFKDQQMDFCLWRDEKWRYVAKQVCKYLIGAIDLGTIYMVVLTNSFLLK